MEQNNTFISHDASIIKSELGENIKIYKSAEIKNSFLGEFVQIGDHTIILESNLNSNIAINRRNFIQQSYIGKFTYTGFNTVIRGAEIGNFCSISWNVSVGGKNHSYENVTTSALWGFHNMNGTKHEMKSFNYGKDKGKCLIGNDVLISSNAVVLRDVEIGNGCVIGAGAVVTKDIEPFSVAVGIPARVIKKRFDDKTIAALEEIKWWDWPKEVIKDNIDLIYSTKVNSNVISKLRNVGQSIT